MRTIKNSQGKIDDTSGLINDACQVVTMFADIGKKVGPYLNNANWISTVELLRAHREPRLRSVLVAAHDKYAADDNWRLQAYDSSLGNTGQWKPITPLAEHPEQLSPRVPLGVRGSFGRLRPGLPRQPQAALGDQIAHDLVRAARDRPRPRVQERVLPVAVVERERIAFDERAARTLQASWRTRSSRGSARCTRSSSSARPTVVIVPAAAFVETA